MIPEFDEVLLTAYLDNEVTDEERATVEAQLQKSEAARKLLEELRSIRNQVIQLALAQPSRSFQNGPWNSPSEAKTVVLSSLTKEASQSSHRKLLYQRLASLAALVAIAVCATVLLWDPKSNPIGQAKPGEIAKVDDEPGKSKKRSAPEQSLESEAPTIAAGAIENMTAENMTAEATIAEAATMKLELKESETTEVLNRGRAKKDQGITQDPMMSGSATFKPESAKFGMPGSSAPSDPSFRFEKPKSSVADGDAPPAVRSMKQKGAPEFDSSASREGVGTGNIADASGQPLSREFKYERMELADSPANVPMPGNRPMAASSSEVQSDDSLNRFLKGHFLSEAVDKTGESQIENFILEAATTSESDSQKSNQDIAVQHLVWQFQKDEGLQNAKGMANDTGSNLALDADARPETDRLSDVGRAVPQSASSADKQASEKNSIANSSALIIEFQIPIEDWTEGANRLRQLGVSVPIELPNTDELEFRAIPTETSFSYQLADAKLNGAKAIGGKQDKRAPPSKKAKQIVKVLIRLDRQP